ncbi:MAG TPA: hypothetical protein VLK58_01210 [Conexibacter sp.]|nr:hypothetical protein [Conexibacter sp.]
MVSESIGVPTRRPAATLVVRPSPQADVGVPTTVTVSGSVEVARRLDVYYAAVMDFRANAGVRFVDVRLSWRRTGERWQREDERAFDGRMSASLWTNCRASGGRLQWILAARDSRGTQRSRRGSFPNATAAQCARG